MTVAEDVLHALRTSPTGMTDAELASLLGKGHQQVNQTCRLLAQQGQILSSGSPGTITNQVATSLLAGIPEQRPPVTPTAAEKDWAWEGNVQARVVTYLAGTGWNIISVADTARRAQGTDILAERDGRRLLVEVKGWPSTTYARGERAGQPKPTQPTLQAAHWFADGLTSVIRRGRDATALLALALPDKPRYRTLLDQVGWALARLDITTYLVADDGSVQTWKREN